MTFLLDPLFGVGMRDHLFINPALLVMYDRTHLFPDYAKEIFR